MSPEHPMNDWKDRRLLNYQGGGMPDPSWELAQLILQSRATRRMARSTYIILAFAFVQVALTAVQVCLALR
jgi:hypothetical protein